MTVPARPTETAEIREALASVTPAMLKAAWGAWHARHGGRLGPGPAYTEALAAGPAVYHDTALAQAAQLTTDLAAAGVRIAALEGAIQAYLDGNYDHPRQHRPGKCRHGIWFYDECGSCADAHFAAALASHEAANVE